MKCEFPKHEGVFSLSPRRDTAIKTGFQMPPATPQRWLFVTGASAGIGKALVARLAAEGCNVIAAARDPAQVAAPDGAPGRVEAVRLDLEDPAAIAHAAREAARIAGDAGLAGLVNMAGIIVEGPLEALPPEALRRQFEVNVVGQVALTQALLPLLARARGAVVNVGAVSAHLTAPFLGPIAASKAALASLNDAMRMEFAPLGVRVFLIEPGAIDTGIFAASRAVRDAWLAQRPDLERRYRPALDAMEQAFAAAGADRPAVVVEAAMAALSGSATKPRVVVGKGTGAFLFLSRLPTRLRDRLVLSALGLGEALKPTHR
jgi:NAD(P)-dependent dehydrogenase (short-subunit alcohol dehydrogenase family)